LNNTMLRKLFTLTLIGCSVVAFLSNEASAKKHKLTDASGKFTTPNIVGKETYVVIGDSYDGVIVVELQLGDLGDGEIVVIKDNTKMVRTRTPKSLTYIQKGNQLQILDQSYNVESESIKLATSNVATFESTSGRVFVMYLGKKTGQVVAKYQMFAESEQCSKSDLEVTSGSPQCDDGFAGSPYATVCRGEFQCPDNFIPTGVARCHNNRWIDNCLPNADALANLPTCTNLNDCPLNSALLDEFKFLDDLEEGLEEISSESAGRSNSYLNKWKSRCQKFCSPRINCYPDAFPSDFNVQAAVRKYITCGRCVHNFNCIFKSGIEDRYHG